MGNNKEIIKSVIKKAALALAVFIVGDIIFWLGIPFFKGLEIDEYAINQFATYLVAHTLGISIGTIIFSVVKIQKNNSR